MNKMSMSFKRLVSALDSLGESFHTTPEEKRKTTILIRACMLTGFFMLLYIGNCVFTEFTLGIYMLPFEALIFFCLPFFIKLGVRPKIIAHVFILNGAAFGVFLVAYSGGLQSPVTPWLTLMPICAILFMDARNAWIWAFIILAVIMFMGLHWFVDGPYPKLYNQDKDALYFLNCYAGLIFIYLLLSLIFENRLNAAIKELEINKLSLEESNNQLNLSILNLKKAQAQLIQSEKMASLGELTAGIAHEIQNPLNFVNNFSELSVDLAKELNEEIQNLELSDKDKQYVQEIIGDLTSNQQKINHHGKRASDIVKGMLQHSRTSSSQKESTDINALCDEYLRLAYHGLKAKDKSFNSAFESKFDSNLPMIDVIPQDIGRVILNIINNAFYAVSERIKKGEDSYEPKVTVSTSKVGDMVEIRIKDNGTGIPDHIKEKIFQPFFTTKPTGQGTGLGLSLSYDIAKAHGGELKVESKNGEGTEFIIYLPTI